MGHAELLLIIHRHAHRHALGHLPCWVHGLLELSLLRLRSLLLLLLNLGEWLVIAILHIAHPGVNNLHKVLVVAAVREYDRYNVLARWVLFQADVCEIESVAIGLCEEVAVRGVHVDLHGLVEGVRL